VASRLGILVREFSAFEMATRVDTFVFDKTGTLTRGQWELLRVEPLGDLSAGQILALAAAVEATSDHQVAVEIRRSARRKQLAALPVSAVEVCDGGIVGRHEGNEVKIGSRGFLQREIDASPAIENPVHLQPEDPVSLVYMSYGGKLCGLLVFGDEIRAGAQDTIASLVRKGYRLFLVSGDGAAATRAVAASLGIPDYRGEQLPWEKASTIDHLRSNRRCISMVGDGVNDAPALAKADLAVAVHSGSPLGKEVAGITLMRGEPSQILDFLQLAGKTHRKVQQNLWCAFVYNAISIPVAMSGLLNPLVAVCAMLLSSLSVIGNTLLLTRDRKEPGE
jgi:P-type E1-E2 ATPase